MTQSTLQRASSTETSLVLGQSTYYDKVSLRDYTSGISWPHSNNSIERANINHVIEYLDGTERIHFFNELWRVLQHDARAMLYLPYWSSPNAYADPYLAWPPLSEISLQYLTSAEFRTRNHLDYPNIKADFDLNWGYSYAPEWHVRSDSRRDDAVKHNIGVVTQLVCTLTKLNQPR